MGWCVFVLLFMVEVIVADRGPDCKFDMVAGAATYYPQSDIKAALETYGPELRRQECDAARAQGKHKQCVVFKPKDDDETYLSMCDHQKWAGSGNRGDSPGPTWTGTKLWPHKDEPFDVCKAYGIQDDCKVVEWQLYPGQHVTSAEWFRDHKGIGEPVMHDETAPFVETRYVQMPRQQVVLCCCHGDRCNTKEKVDAYTGPFPDETQRECIVGHSVWSENDGPNPPGLGYWRNVSSKWQQRRQSTQIDMREAKMASKSCVVYGAGDGLEHWAQAGGRQFWMGQWHSFSGSTLGDPKRSPFVAPDLCELYGIEGDGCKMVKWQLFPPTHPNALNASTRYEDGDWLSPIFYDHTTTYNGIGDQLVDYPVPTADYIEKYIPQQDVKLCCCQTKDRCNDRKFLVETPIGQPTTTKKTTTRRPTTTRRTTTPSTTTPTTKSTTTPTTSRATKQPTTTTKKTTSSKSLTTTRGEKATKTSTKSSTRHSTPRPTVTGPKEATTYSSSAPKRTTTTVKEAEGKPGEGGLDNARVVVKIRNRGADSGSEQHWLFVICLICIYIQL